MTIDLNNADLDQLDALLAMTPEPLQPLDAVRVDGYLAGIAVQPQIVAIDQWLPGIFDRQGRSLPDHVDPAWVARIRSLVERRYAVMALGLEEEAWFDPIIVDVQQLPPPSEYEAAVTPEQRTLGPWVEGFDQALARYPGLQDLAQGDSEVQAALNQVRQAAQGVGHDAVLAKLDEEARVSQSVDALLNAVADLWSLTEGARLHVEPVRRVEPKVGRNDPCPCGSGRKFKVCHGKA